MNNFFSKIFHTLTEKRILALVFSLMVVGIIIVAPSIDNSKTAPITSGRDIICSSSADIKISESPEAVDNSYAIDNNAAENETNENPVADENNQTDNSFQDPSIENSILIAKETKSPTGREQSNESYSIVDDINKNSSKELAHKPIEFEQSLFWKDSYYSYEDEDINVDFGDKNNEESKVAVTFPVEDLTNDYDVVTRISNWLDGVTNQDLKKIKFALIDSTNSDNIENYEANIQSGTSNNSLWDYIKNFFTRIHEDNPENLEILQDSSRDIIINNNVLENVDVKYQILPNQGIKEEIIIVNNSNLNDVFIFDLTLENGVGYQLNNDLTIDAPADVYYFTDSKGRYIAHFLSLIANDQTGATTGNISLEITPTTVPDKHTIKLFVDKEWLQSPDRQFPISIDPSIVHDTQTEFDTAKALNRVTTTADPSIELSGPPYKNYGVYTSDVIDFGSDTPIISTLEWTENAVQTGNGETDLTTNGLVAKWNFNETSGTTAGDSSGNGHNGTLTNMTTTSQDASVNSGWTANNKKWGTGSVMFDGSNDYIDVPSFTFNENGIFAVSFWMNPVKTGTNLHYLLDFRNADANGQSAVISYDHNNTGAIDYTIYGESNWHNGTIPLSERSWNHVVVIHNSNTNNLRTYINGQLDQNVSVNDFTITGSPLRIGARRLTGAAPYKGSIDAIKIFNRDLSENEIISLYNSTNIEFQTRTGSDNNPYDGGWEEWKPAGSGTETQLDAYDNQYLYSTSESGLNNYWPMDELTGSNVNEPINTADGTATGTKIIDGKYAKARNFNGSSDYISISDNSVLNPGNNFTIESWIYQPAISDNGAIISTMDVTNGVVTKGYAFKTNTSSLYGLRANSLLLQLGTPTWNWGNWTSPTNSLTPGRWHHVAVTVANANTASKTVYFYIDGKQYPGAFWTNNSQQVVNFNTNTTSSRIGGIYTATMPSYNTTYFNGNIDELKIYSTILSADQISQNYLEGKELFNLQPCVYQTNNTDIKVEGSYSSKNSFGHAISSQNLVALWHLDETGGSGAYLKDSSGNGNHATPSGSNNYVMNGIMNKGRKTVNGSNITVPNSTSLRPSGAFSFNFWIKTNGLNSSAQSYFINKETWSSSGWAILDNGSYTSDIMFRVLPSGTGTCGTGVACMSRTLVNDNNWHMISGVYNGTNIILYLDGIQKDSRSAGSFTTSSANILMNHTSGSPNGVLMDEISIYSTALSINEINELFRLGRDHYINNSITSVDLSDSSKLAFYAASDQPGQNYDLIIGESAFANYQPDENTLGLWHLEEYSGTGIEIIDSSGRAIHGSQTNATSISGVLGQAKSFSGSGYVDLSSNVSKIDGYNSGTISAWFKTSAAGYIFSLSDKDTVSDFMNLYVGDWTSGCSDDSLAFTVTRGNSAVLRMFVTEGQTKYLDNQWHHVVVSNNSGTNKIFIDGQEKAVSACGSGSATSSEFSNINNPDSMYIGRRYIFGYNNYFTGSIDEVRIDSVAYNAEDVRQAYELEKRSHLINFDFAASLDSGNVISGSGDYSFTVDATTKGLSAKGEGLYVGDKIIVKENYDGTEYVAQGTVEAVNQTTGAVVVSAWNAGSTFPSGGFTQYADAFKWQREYFDLTGILDDHLKTAQLITIRKTNGNNGSTIWLDDLNSIDNYLTDPAGSTILSTDNRYFQYRAILTTNQNDITPSLSDVTVNFFEAVDPSYDSAATSQSSLNLNNQTSFNVQCVGVDVYAAGETVTCQGSWDNNTWNAINAATSPLNGVTIQGTPNVSSWPGYPSDGSVNMYVRLFVDGEAYDTKTLSITKDTVRPTINGITSVAGDTTDPYLDPTDDGSTIVNLNTTGVAACRWDESDTDYASMSETCSSPGNCELDLTGGGGHIVYFHCIDSATNTTASSFELTYSITWQEDWDGIPYASDNCPVDYNPNQYDLDGDTVGDACDTETLISSNTNLPAGEYNFKYLHITNNATLTVLSNTGLSFPGAIINGENVTVDNGSKISADQKGYPCDQGPGAGAYGNSTLQAVGGNGADHGSRGGDGINHSSGDSSYGNAYAPSTLGSGGGNMNAYGYTYGYYGGPGGGAIKINLTGTLENNGTISANAGDAIYTGYGFPQGSGGGAGGSLWITADTLNGNGAFLSNGGAATHGANCSTCYGGGGSGGRISINYTTNNFTGQVQAKGNTGNQRGEDGTITFNGNMSNSCDSGNPFTHCYINQLHHLPDNLSYEFANLTIQSGGRMEFKNNYTGTIEPGNLTIESGGLIYINNSADVDITSADSIDIDGEIYVKTGTSGDHSTLSLSGENITISGNSTEGERWSKINLYADNTLLIDGLVKATWIDITGNNVNVASSGQIITDTLGYPSTTGPGAGAYGNSVLQPVGATGAGHGAIGGAGLNQSPGGSSYGDQDAPVELGSGGGSQTSSWPDYGGPGGGAIKININGTLTNNGIISSNASDAIYSGYGVPQGSGGGAGGSVWLISDSITGAGQIEADGGNGNDGINAPVAYGGCGAGGRIKIVYVSDNFTGNVTADGGTVGHAVPCAAGTIVYTQNSSTLPRVNSVTSVAGDTSTPYEDMTDNNNTLVEFTTLNSPTNVKWDTVDTDYDSMSNSCGSNTQCALNLAGNGVKTVYFRATDGSGNKSASSYSLQYTINDPSITEPFVNSITSVAGDDTSPYVDVSDDGHTLVIFTTINNSSNVKWDTVDTDYDSMSENCGSVAQCDLDLTGEGVHVVYFRATDASGNKSSSSTQLQYTVRNTRLTNTLNTSQPGETDLTMTITIVPEFAEAITDGSIKIKLADEFDFSGLTRSDVSAIGGDVTWTDDETIYAGGTQIAKSINPFINIAKAQGENSITYNFTGDLNSEDGEITFIIGGLNQPGNPPTEGPYSYIVEWYELHNAAGSPLYIKDGKVYINQGINVSAAVPTSLTFAIAGLSDPQTVNGATTNLTTTDTYLDFGTFTGNQNRIGAHDLSVSSNATDGFIVTVKTTGNFTTGSNNINDFTGTNSAPASWVSPPGSGTESYWGYTSDDDSLSSGTIDRFIANKWAGFTTSPAEIFHHDRPADGATTGAGTTRIGYRMEVTGNQEAGVYTTSIVYVCTATY